MTAPAEIRFRFNPSSAKSRKVLGPLEGEIMEVVWEQGRTTVSAVHKELREKKDIAYTTVMTTMSRLAKKRLLLQDRSTSVYAYSPALTRTDFDHYVVMGVVNALLDDYGTTVVDCFAEAVKSRGDDLEQQAREAVCS